MGSSARPHVALLPFPFGSHPGPMLRLARALAAAEPGAVFSFLSTERCLASLPRASPPLPNLRFQPVPDGLEEGHAAAPPPGHILKIIQLFVEAAPENLRAGLAAAKEAAGGVSVSCVVSDAFLWMAGQVAEEMGVPWVPLWAGGSLALAAHLYTDLLREKLGVGDQAIAARANECLQFIPGLSAMLTRDLPEGIVFGDLDSVVSRLLHRMGKEMPRATAVVLNTLEGLDPGIDADFKAKFKKFLPVGPLNLLAPQLAESDVSGCLSWLDRQHTGSVAYVSFSTVMLVPPPELAALAEGLEESGVPFLWSLKDVLREHLPPGFLDRTSGHGLVVPWAPQPQVLGHAAVGVFVTHGGWNSVIECIAGGVPMVCRPLFGDQRFIARSVSHVWGIGVGLEGGTITKEAVAVALKAILRSEEGKKMKEKARELQLEAFRVIGPGGSSMVNFKSLLEIISGC